MADGMIAAVVIFGFVLILGLIAGVIAFIIIERNKKKKEKTPVSKDPTPPPENSFTIQTVSTSIKYLAVNLTNLGGVSNEAKLLFNDLDSNPCGNYQILQKDVNDIKDTFTITTPLQAVTTVGGRKIIPETTFILGADDTGENDVTLFTQSDDFISQFKNVEKFPSSNTNVKYSWKYDDTDKTWCLEGSQYCLYRSGDTVKIKIPDSPIDTKRQFNNIIPPPITDCKGNDN